MTTAADVEKAHEPKDLDLSAAGRGVWLVKIPKYLSEQWKTCASGTDVGKLRIAKSKIPNKKPDIMFTSYDVSKSISAASASVVPATTTSSSASSGPMASFLQAKAPIGPLKPHPVVKGNRNHKFLVTGVSNQNLVVMSQNGDGDKISVEGKVLQRAECNPIEDAHYRQLKREQVQAQNTPTRQIKLLPTVVNTYKPVSHHTINAFEGKTKKNETKRIRAEKDKVTDILFRAFEKHQFYNVKDLVGITKQPLPYLKEILKEYCNYNMTSPHKNMWELKPEFRHYKQDGEG